MQSDLRKELGTNFIEYAAAVNTDRAIPDARSGLKPVARRILYGAFDGGRTSNKPHVKCARIVGDVMGKYHPHGDSSIYGALVRLSQPWVMRYPLIDFHGNQGNIGGDGPAASRYTEARLSKISEDGLLQGLKKKNVDFIPNYDETEVEPETLPSIFPNLLCNPNTGIGVAIAANWLPHNLGEVGSAIIDYIEGKEPKLLGPDFPTGGLIINGNDLPNIIKSGHGSVKVRARYKVEKQNLVFYEIPYGTNTESILAEIGKMSDEKEIEGIAEIRDESNKKGMRLVIQCKTGVSPDTIAHKLYIKTNLQTSISYNQVALVDKVPTELGLVDCIKIYIEHNLECIRRETKFDLDKAEARLHIVDGLLKALEDIDNIIKLIKASNNATEAKSELMKKYNFSEIQAKAILDMKLAKLAHLEKVELEKEKDELEDRIKDFKIILSNRDAQENILKIRLTNLVNKYGDDRRTEITHINISPKEKEIEMVAPEDCVVICAQSGDIKRIPSKTFKRARRNTKGVKTEDDAILSMISTNTIDNLLLFTSKGKMYKLLVDTIPVGTNASKGVSINTLVKFEPGEKVIAITSLDRKCEEKYIVFGTKQGLIKKTALSEYKSIKRNAGTVAIKLKEGDSITNVEFMNEEDIFMITKMGMCIRFESKNITAIGRNTSGVKSIKLNDNDEVIKFIPIKKDIESIGFFTKMGSGKKTAITEFFNQGRGGKGVKCSSAELGAVVGLSKDSQLLVIGHNRSLCISENDLPKLTRTSVGNIVIKDSVINSVVRL